MFKRIAWTVVVLAMTACGGGGNDAGTSSFGDGPGAAPFAGSGPGTPPFTGGTGGGSGGSGGSGPTGDGPRPAPDPTVVVSTAAVQGQVFDAEGGTALVGASVNIGTSSVSSNAEGFYALATAPPAERVVISAQATGREPIYMPTQVVAGVPSVTGFKLSTQAAPVSVGSAPESRLVTASDTVTRVDFSNSSLTQSGGPPATSVNVRLTPLALGGDTFRISGDYKTGAGENLEAFGALVLSNSEGVAFGANSAARLRVKVDTRSDVRPLTATAYHLDTTTGYWTAAGPATLDASGAYYEADIDRFGQWLVAQVISQPATVRGCVVNDAGVPVANVRIVLEGISYSGASYVTTNAGGAFEVNARPNSRVLISGRQGPVLTNAVSAESGQLGVLVAACLTLPTANAATVRLTWGRAPADIDSHVHEPGGEHVYFASLGSLTGGPNVQLDVDDTNSFGPEITSIRRPKVGIYRFYLHNFSGTFSPGMTGSPVSVELIYLGRTVVFTSPVGEVDNRHWHLFDLEIAEDCSMTLYRYNRWRSDEPRNPNPTISTRECVPL